MKQSVKLLSMVLALVMAFSCLSVIGNAALVQSEVTWDCIDDADLTAEQVADLALDLVDNDLLSGMDTIDLSIIGELRLNKIDYIFEDIVNLRGGFIWSIGSGLLKNLGAMDFAPLNKGGDSWGFIGIGGDLDPYQRSDGDLVVIGQLLEFIGNDCNSEILSRVAYGLGDNNSSDNDEGDLTNTTQLNLGLIDSFLDLGDVGDLLNDLPGFLKTMVYDMLIYGSYGYNDDSETLGTLPTDMDTLDEMINNALLNLLINPQDYTWEGEGDAAEKIWDTGSVILPSVAEWVSANGRDAAIGYISPITNSLFGILDTLAQFAIDDVAINALNNNLKKALMLAVEADLNEVDITSLPASVATAFETSKDEDDKSYVTYLAYDKLAKYGNAWYYTTLEREVEEDPTTGEPVLDEEGNEVSVKVRKYFRVNMAAANEFASMINWNWTFVGSEGGDGISLLYSDITANGSIASGINDLIGLVYENGLTDAAKADFEEMTGAGWLEGNDNINDNIVRVTKYILANFGDKVFGEGSAYASYTWDDLEPLSIVEMVALIGPEFFEDAMPQIILPKNEDGTYAFHDGVQLWEFAAIVLRELITGIAPNVNYDAYIFANGDVTSADDRLFVEQDADAWYNIILNMGLDLALEYLVNITNFRDFCAEQYGESFDLDAYITAGGGTDASHWQTVLNAAILWATKYVGCETSTSVLNGLDFTSVSAISDPFDKLSYILNTILPLGIVNGYYSDTYALDVGLLAEGIKGLLTDFDLNYIINLFGRPDAHYNAFNDVPIVQAALDLVNGIVSLVITRTDGINLLQSTDAQSVDAVLTQANLKYTVGYLLRQLYAHKDALLNNALPVVGKLIKGWGTEQSFKVPDVGLSRSISLTDGVAVDGDGNATSVEVQVRNASNGVWRHYRDASGNEYTDNQYQIKLTSVTAYDGITETVSSTVTPTLVTTTNIDYGQYGTFTYTASGVGADGDLVRFDVKYQVIDEDGNLMADGKIFSTKAYAWLNYNDDNSGDETYWDNDGSISYAAMNPNQYVALSSAAETIPEIVTGRVGRDYKLFTSAQQVAITPATATVDGITMGTVSVKISNSSGGRYYNNIKQFQTATYTAVNEDGEEQSDTITVSGSFNESTWAATNKASGDTSVWSVTLTAKGNNNDASNFTIHYYDDVYLNKLTSLAANEMDATRLTADYNLTGTAYAGKILTYTDSEDEEGEKVLRDSNFSDIVWIANDDAGTWAGTAGSYTNTVTEYAEANVSDIVEETDENGNVIAASGTVTVDGEEIAVKKVTKIDCATAINAYVAAFEPGVRGGMQVWNENSVYNFEELYDALKVTSDDVSYCKKSVEVVIAEGNGDNVSGAIETLAADLQTIEETYTYEYDFTDYKMYRLNRLNDAREDAHAYIQLADDASPATVEEIDEYFDYNWMEENDYRALVSGDKYETILLALLEQFDEEEIAAKAEWLEAKKLELNSTSLLDIEITQNLLTRTSQRLLNRVYGTIDTQLCDEITSAQNMIGDDSSAYTEKSWARYQEALDNAIAVRDADGVVKSQKNIFAAKYQLLIQRKALVPADMEADYTELEALIAQAEHALANMNLYNNTNKEFGQVLAELGYNEIDDTQLFPGSALLVLAEGYHVDDQDKVDSAADALKEALARLEFKNTAITGNGVTVSESTLVEADEDKGIEAVVATTANVAENLDADAIKALFTVTADGATVTDENITVSNDYYYTIDTDLEGFAGTSSVVTFYTVQDGIKIPVATIKLIVNGDINGDGTVDALDGAYAALVESEKTTLEGCYLLAGDLANSDRELTADDYSAIVNLVVD